MPAKRLRLFAGPNGSGKSTIIEQIPANIRLGYKVNADEIEKRLSETGNYPLDEQGITTDEIEFRDWLLHRGFSVSKLDRDDFVNRIRVIENSISVPPQDINSYLAADLSGFIREKHLEQGHSFTFESVVSHKSKLEFLSFAKQEGYRVYLYYIATESADINVNRVQIRVSQNGHAVDEQTIRRRYANSLNLLYRAIKISDRAFLFDNSGRESIYVAEITDGEEVEIKCPIDQVPNWFIEHVIQRN